MRNAILIIIIFALGCFLAYVLINKQSSMGNLILKSSAFKEGETIPSKFTCDGDNINPLLEIRNIPTGTKSLVLIMDDPDATGGQTWDHWILFNIDPKTQYIYENSSTSAMEGMNSFKKIGYGGPCPPRGNPPHRYLFKLYALDILLDLPEGASKPDIEQAMAGHILNQTVLMGRYGRQ